MDVDPEGFVPAEQLLKRLRKRGFDLSQEDLEKIVREDAKGRYDLFGGRIRARYGHSIDVEPDLEERDVPEVLYHGTGPQAADRILEEGLQPRGRQKVHLSGTRATARDVGTRHHPEPVILEIDCQTARQAGIVIERAASDVYVADAIPPRFISRLTNEH